MLRRAVELRPNDGYIVDSLGWAHYKLGQYAEATETLEKAIDLKPADPVLNDHLGDAYWRVNRRIEAHFQWNHARDMGPDPEDLPEILKKIKDGLPDADNRRRARQKHRHKRKAAAEPRHSASMRWQRAPAKINLTLRVIGRRDDGYHELESLVAFAGLGDWLGFEPGDDLTLEVLGPRADRGWPCRREPCDARRACARAHAPGLRLGRFRLIKRLPAAAGLGGGSADAAAALRLLADQVRTVESTIRGCARPLVATGADVPACLSPQARIMKGIGDQLGPAIRLPSIFAVLVNPQVQAPTPKVFAALGLAPRSRLQSPIRSFPEARSDRDALLDSRLSCTATIWRPRRSGWRRRSPLCSKACPKSPRRG